MATYKLIKGHMSGGYAEGDLITSEDLAKNGVGEERALELGVLERVDEEPPVPEPEPVIPEPEVEPDPESEPETGPGKKRK